ncbi:MAG: ABC transporter substrate-binding protein [Anaerolineae bacterium]
MKRFVALLCLVIGLLIVACAPSPSPSGVAITDALGRTVSLEGPPERIAIGGRANFMLNDAVYTFPDVSDRVVALTQATQRTIPFISLLDPDFEEKVVLTSESTAEEIAATQPDVVLLKRFMRESVGDSLEAAGIPVIYLDLETPEQYERDLETLGAVFANPERADVVWGFYQTRMQRIAEQVDGLQEAEKPSVLVLQYDARGAETALKVPPPSWIQTQMVTLTGGDPVWTDAGGGGWTVVGFEQIAAWNPDRIFVISYFDDVDDVVNRLAADPGWQQLTAVQNGQLFGFPKDFYSWDQPDTRWALGLMWMASRMHPERFGDIDMAAEIDAFYDELYGLDAATIEAQVLPLLEGDILTAGGND